MKHIVTTVIYLCALILPVTTLIAQNSKKTKSIKPLSIGSKVRDFALSGLMNYRSKTAKLSDFKSKLLIIDFWATWCGSCLASFPKLEKIKQELGNDLNILLVTREDEKTVNTFYERRKRFKKDRLPFIGICNDKTLNGMFPHQSIPHYVWIDEKGIVRAITSADEVSVENIKALIGGKTVMMEVKNDEINEIFHDPAKPLFINGNGGDGNTIIWHSVLSGEVKGLQSVGGMHIDKGIGFVEMTNTDIYTLYKKAYSDDNDYFDSRIPNSRIVFKVKDSLQYFRKDEGTKHISGILYCYNLLTPEINQPDLKTYFQSDLKKYFGLNVRWEKRRKECLVITAEDTTLIAPVSKDYYANKSTRSSEYNYVLPGAMKWFRLSLESYFFYSPYPILDETGSKGRANFDIEADMSDWQSIDKALSKYKMHLRLEEREVNVLVVSEPGLQ